MFFPLPKPRIQYWYSYILNGGKEKCFQTENVLYESISNKSRGGGIRTRDPLLPKQVR